MFIAIFAPFLDHPVTQAGFLLVCERNETGTTTTYWVGGVLANCFFGVLYEAVYMESNCAQYGGMFGFPDYLSYF